MYKVEDRTSVDRENGAIHISNKTRTRRVCLIISMMKKFTRELMIMTAKKIDGIAAIKTPNPEIIEVKANENIKAQIRTLLGRTLHPCGHARMDKRVDLPK